MNDIVKKKLSNKMILSFSALFTAVFIFAEHFFAQYSDIDNYLISVVTNCIYSDENFTFFVHPFLCALIKLLRHISIRPDWYLLIVEICVSFAFFCLEKMIFAINSDNIKKAFCEGIFAFFLILSIDPFHVNFTVMTAVLCFMGSLLILVGIENPSRRFERFSGILIWIVSCLFRIETCLVMLLFLLLSVAYLLLKSLKKEAITSLISTFSVLFIGLLVMFAGREIILHSDKYESGYNYSVTRSAITDYYEDGSVYIHFLMDTEGLDEEGLNDVLSEQKQSGKLMRDDNFIRGFFNTFTEGKLGLLLSFLVLILVVLCLLNSKEDSLFAILIILIGFAGCVYYYLSGRLPERIILLFDLGMLSAFMGLYFRHRFVIKKSALFIALWAVAVLIFVYPNYDYSGSQNVFLANVDNEPENIGITVGDDVYIWDVFLFDVNIMYPYWNAGKLFSKELVRTNIPDGEWIYNQPYFKNMLEEIGMTNPMYSLLNNDGVYYVSYGGNVINVIDYCLYRRNISVEALQIGSFDIIPINKFTVK